MKITTEKQEDKEREQLARYIFDKITNFDFKNLNI